ncbi:DUF5071 domain-containing protein [Pedobacter sp. BMA]|uniref:DUF5071 domain-containing protein n=1 Tax=Pedobacter sp. BMA TaxID=1663685 RepID=UPI0018CD5FBA|nr:DUF5071 domain-containing protein [Pedobacter sp. BMA]
MNEKKEYIPTNVYDVDAIKKLRVLPFEAVKADVPKLLEWLKDIHWPVAQGVAEYLLPYINEINEELLVVLNTNDGMWKYFMIYKLIGGSNKRLNPELILALRNIADNPTPIELEDLVDEAARDILMNKILCG